MDSREVRDLMEAYLDVYASEEEIDEATAMAKHGHDETAIRNNIAKSTGGGKSADRATTLASRETYGDSNRQNQRQNYARAQRRDFRNTASSSPGLHGYAHQSDDPKVKAKQAARAAQRSRLTPNEGKQLNMGDDFANWVDALLDEGYDLSDYTWDEVYGAYTELLESERQRYKPDPKSTGYGSPEQMNRKPEDRKIPNKDTAEWLIKDAKTKKYGRPMRKYQPGVIKRGDIERQGIRTIPQVVRRNPDEFKPVPILQNNSYDYYDVVLAHLVSEGYANNFDSAIKIMVNMSEEWVNKILDEAYQLDEISDRRVQRAVNARNRKFWLSTDSGAPNKEFKLAKRINKAADRRNKRTGANVKVDKGYTTDEL